MSLVGYLNRVQNAIDSCNGAELCHLLQSSNAQMNEVLFQQRSNTRWDPSNQCRKVLYPPWSDLISSHLLCWFFWQRGERLAAYEALCPSEKQGEQLNRRGVQVLGEIVRDENERPGWLVIVYSAMAHNIKAVAQAADEELKRRGLKPNKLEDCGRVLQSFFQVLGQSKNAEKKRSGLSITNTMIKVYFRLNILNNCKNAIKPFTDKYKVMPDLEAFPVRDQVCHRYYTGRLALYEENYTEADDHLSFAFAHCVGRSAVAQRNQRRILKYLVPVRLLLGTLPTARLLEHHRLQEYQDIARAVRDGDVGLLNRAMESNQFRFIHNGTFLLLEKLRMSAYRRLLKKCHQVHAEAVSDPKKSFQLPLQLFRHALIDQGVDMDMDELECIMANMIFMKYVKGYISHKSKVMVLSGKGDAFPPMSEVSMKDPVFA